MPIFEMGDWFSNTTKDELMALGMPPRPIPNYTSVFAQELEPEIKNYVLDTCVLLHDPEALLSFQEHNVYLPLVVIEELDKFNVIEYAGTYMPKTYRYFLFANGECIGDYGNKYITHGSDSIEELLVPGVSIGETQNG